MDLEGILLVVCGCSILALSWMLQALISNHSRVHRGLAKQLLSVTGAMLLNNAASAAMSAVSLSRADCSRRVFGVPLAAAMLLIKISESVVVGVEACIAFGFACNACRWTTARRLVEQLAIPCWAVGLSIAVLEEWALWNPDDGFRRVGSVCIVMQAPRWIFSACWCCVCVGIASLSYVFAAVGSLRYPSRVKWSACVSAGSYTSVFLLTYLPTVLVLQLTCCPSWQGGFEFALVSARCKGVMDAIVFWISRGEQGMTRVGVTASPVVVTLTATQRDAMMESETGTAVLEWQRAGRRRTQTSPAAAMLLEWDRCSSIA
mmetsp:Transcript_70806/g.162332  ORF Transcript_70806/g.162332 Transcript_70806/m.162332 type:complete len:318 (+) Transcript_70806:2-955(+)